MLCRVRRVLTRSDNLVIAWAWAAFRTFFPLLQATKDEEVCSELCTLLSQHLRKRLSSIKPDDLFKLAEVHPELLSVAIGQVRRMFLSRRFSSGC